MIGEQKKLRFFVRLRRTQNDKAGEGCGDAEDMRDEGESRSGNQWEAYRRIRGSDAARPQLTNPSFLL